MSAIVKGMEKPRTCIDCVFLSKAEEIYEGNDRYSKIRRCLRAPDNIEDPYRKESWFVCNTEDFCPIVEVPDRHGELIDRDALRKAHAQAERGAYGGIYVVGANRFMQRFEAAPVVVGAEAPAESEEEEDQL